MIESPNSDALSFIDDVKGYFFLEEISVFTPNGELRTLPASSTVLDFAYAIHSEIGNTCIGAKVDKKLVPMNHSLKNGQQVEIITSKKQTPREEWLSYVVTTRAKSNIKLAVRAEKKKFSKQGREKLGKWFLQLDIDFTHENIKRFLEANNFTTLTDLFYAASQDKIGIKDVKIFASSNYRSGWLHFVNRPETKSGITGALPGHSGKTETTVPAELQAARELRQKPLEYEVATCCNPIPGDEVIGLLASDSLPLQIHRTKCTRAQEQITIYGTRMVKIDWKNEASIAFLTEIKISGIDRQGLINEISRIISNELNLNIQSFNIEAHNGLTSGAITLFIQDLADLNEVLANLGKVEGITTVMRVD
jgi:GTP pyrophosphokinase